MILFITINLILFFTVTIIVRHACKPRAYSDYVLSCGTLFVSIALLSEILLGLLHKLTFYYLLLLISCVFCLTALYFRKTRGPLAAPLIPRLNPGFAVRDNYLLACVSLLGGFILIKSFLILTRPPFGWDPLVNHLAFPAAWIHSKTLAQQIVVFGEPAPAYYPISSELFYLWLMLPFSSSFMADLAQAFFFLIAITAVYAICRQLRMSAVSSLCACLVFAFTPQMFKQIELTMNDIMAPAFFLSSVYFLLRLKDGVRVKNVFLAGCAAGVFFGIKTSSIAYSGLLVMLLIFVLRKKTAFTGALKCLGYFIALTAIVGGYKYIHNFMLTGNPIYPAEVRLFGAAVFRGVENFSGDIFKIKIPGFTLRGYMFHEGLGIQFALFAVIGAVASAPLYLFNKRRAGGMDTVTLYLLLLPLFVFLIFYFAVPFRCPRYLYTFIGLGCVAFFYVLRLYGFPERFLKICSLGVVLISVAEIAKYLELACGLALSALIFLLLRYGRGILAGLLKRKRARAISLMALFVLMLLMENDYNKNSYDRYITGYRWEAERIEGWKWINKNVSGKRIAYTATCAPYPLYGVKLTNSVEYVSVNDKSPYLHSYPDGSYRFDGDSAKFFKSLENDGNYRERADYPAWRKNLLERKIDYLFISDLYFSRNFPIEEEWARDHPEIFKLVFSNPRVRIYEVAHEKDG